MKVTVRVTCSRASRSARVKTRGCATRPETPTLSMSAPNGALFLISFHPTQSACSARTHRRSSNRRALPRATHRLAHGPNVVTAQRLDLQPNRRAAQQVEERRHSIQVKEVVRNYQVVALLGERNEVQAARQG